MNYKHIKYGVFVILACAGIPNLCAMDDVDVRISNLEEVRKSIREALKTGDRTSMGELLRMYSCIYTDEELDIPGVMFNALIGLHATFRKCELGIIRPPLRSQFFSEFKPALDEMITLRGNPSVLNAVMIHFMRYLYIKSEYFNQTLAGKQQELDKANGKIWQLQQQLTNSGAE